MTLNPVFTMKTLFLALAATLSLTAVCSAQQPLTGGIQPQNPGMGEVNSVIENHLFELVNRYRTDKGLPAFKRDERLSEVARQNVLRMFAKGWVDSRDYCVRQEEVLAVMPKLTKYGENFSFSFPRKENLAGRILQEWLSIQRFQYNLINDYQLVGVVSICDPSGDHFVVMNFAKEVIEPGKQEPMDSSTQPVSAPAPSDLQQPQQADHDAPVVEDIYGLSQN